MSNLLKQRETPRTSGQLARGLLLAVPMLPVGVIAFAIFAALVRGFVSTANLSNMMLQFTPLLVCSCGATLVFLIGGIDLSAGAVMSVAAVSAAMVMRRTGSVTLGLLAGVGCGVVVGIADGLAIGRFRLVPFVQTLAALLTVRAIAFLLSGGHSIGRLPKGALALGRQYFLGVPAILWFAILVAVVLWFVLARTSYGRKIYLIGANRRASVFCGVEVQRYEFVIYMVSAALAACGGTIAVLWLGSGAPVLGDTFLLADHRRRGDRRHQHRRWVWRNCPYRHWRGADRNARPRIRSRGPRVR